MTDQDSATRRHEAAEAFFRALRRGEPSAAVRVAPYLAPDATLESPWERVSGAAAVVEHVGRRWPFTGVYELGTWTGPHPDGDTAVITGEFPRVGAAPKAAVLTFTFGPGDRIVKVVEAAEPRPRAEAVTAIPAEVAGIIDGALANGTPLTVAYVSGDGVPELSLRGSVQVFGPAELSIWVRNPKGGLVSSLDTNPNVSLLYRDSKLRTTLVIKGRARVDDGEEARRRAYELAPEVEQMHDPAREGAALIIDVTQIAGSTPQGAVLMRRAG
ncbi:MAG TPA: pyridoxamine 5'-phosphate oxidase family protein [Trebonia sp.]